MDSRKRKRGIKASREKLDMAMLDANIKTQASLAEKIAEAFHLSTPPKDTVNRAFRGEFVSPITLARIARVLQVEPGCLYREEQLNGLDNRSGDELLSPQQPATQPKMGKYSLVVKPLTGEMMSFAKAVNQQLQVDVNSVVITSGKGTASQLSVDVARKYQADGVLSLRSQAFERYLMLQAFLYFDGIEKLIWTKSLPAVDFRNNPFFVAGFLRTSLLAALGLETSESTAECVSIEDQENFLKARHMLDDAQDELILIRAKERLNSLLAHAPDFADALAALALCFLFENWRGTAKSLLDEAEKLITKAMKLGQDEPFVTVAAARFYLETGDESAAIKLCNELLEKDKSNIDVHITLLSIYHEIFKEGTSKNYQAEQFVEQYIQSTTTVEPDYFLPFMLSGTIRYYQGRTEEALQFYEKSVALKPQEVLLNNLGAVYICRGELSSAHKHLEKLVQLDVHSWGAYERLGQIYFFSGDIEKSIEYRNKALNSFPDRDKVTKPEMWGPLADCYRLIGDISSALTTYSKTIEYLERCHLKGSQDQTNRVLYIYYYFVLSEYLPDDYPVDRFKEFEKELPEFIDMNLRPLAYIKLACMFFDRGYSDLVTQAVEKAGSNCPVYYYHPDLIPIIRALNIPVPEIVEPAFA